MAGEVVVWDFNGTLIDDLDAAIAAVNDMLADRGGQSIDRARYHALMEMPILGFYRKLEALRDMPADQIAEEFNAGYARHGHLVRPAAGSAEVLARLRAAGRRQVVISAFEQSRICDRLRQFGLLDFFDQIVGAQDLHAGSKIERARAWARQSGAAPGGLWVVGDLVHDWDMARAMGARCVLVSWGHQARCELAACGVPVVDAMGQIPPLLAGAGEV